jgi:hypothetical protein
MENNMNRNVRLWCLAVLLFTSASVGATESLRIVPLVYNDSVIVTIELADAYSDDIRDAIASGLRTTFTYDISLRMHAPIWVDRTIATAVVSNIDEYDNLTRRHHLSRLIDGRLDEAVVTEDEAVARHWLTTLTRLPVCPTSKLDPSRDYYVTISAQVRPQRGSLLGWVSAITGSVRFTFIP